MTLHIHVHCLFVPFCIAVTSFQGSKCVAHTYLNAILKNIINFDFQLLIVIIQIRIPYIKEIPGSLLSVKSFVTLFCLGSISSCTSQKKFNWKKIFCLFNKRWKKNQI